MSDGDDDDDLLARDATSKAISVEFWKVQTTSCCVVSCSITQLSKSEIPPFSTNISKYLHANE